MALEIGAVFEIIRKKVQEHGACHYFSTTCPTEESKRSLARGMQDLYSTMPDTASMQDRQLRSLQVAG